MKKIIVLLLLSMLFLASCAQEHKSFEQMATSMTKSYDNLVSVTELSKQLKEQDILLLDSREKKEFEVSHIKKANYVGYNKFDISRFESIDKKTPIVVYCSVGYRSAKICEKLTKKGFTNVKNLYGGIFKWANDGFDVVDGNNAKVKVHPYDKDWGKWLKEDYRCYE